MIELRLQYVRSNIRYPMFSWYIYDVINELRVFQFYSMRQTWKGAQSSTLKWYMRNYL
jgi:hypothetical protein